MSRFALYEAFIRIKIKAMTEYRAAFIWQGLAQASSYVAEFIVLWILIHQFDAINGWMPFEVLFLYALQLLTFALAGCFVQSVSNGLPTMIRDGSFDEVLTKPMNPLLYLICHRFVYQYASHIIVSSVIIVLCFMKLDLAFTFGSAVQLFLVLVGATCIQATIFMCTAIPAFWTVQSQGISGLIQDFRSFIRYPISIYKPPIQIVLTLVFPYAFINFYPAQYFLEKNDFLMFHPLFQYGTPFVGLILLLGMYQFWLAGIRSYKSTGT